MITNKSVSIAIPYHGDRRKYTGHTLQNAGKMPWVKEVVVTLEPGSVCNITGSKLKKYQNAERLYVFRNKYEAVSRCTGEWVALVDSDNIVDKMFFEAITTEVNQNIIYCPEVGWPNLNYEHLVGYDISSETVVSMMQLPNFDTCMNTMNYIFHRKTWLDAVRPAIEDSYEPWSADSIWINYWCLKAGMVMRVIRGMRYIHTVDDTSFFKNNSKVGLEEYPKIFQRMRDEWGDKVPNQKQREKENWSAIK